MNTAVLVFTGFLLVALILGYVLVTIPRWLAPKEPSAQKSRTYECGEIPVGEPRVRFHTGYYIFALAFVVFDVEAVLLFPWAVIMHKLGAVGLVQMGVFIAILMLGLVYAWRKGVLEWA
ncbi:MAG: NADH-quinone oxidoreductase subunit A [Coriobacteriia bacterium]|nr:NADH-quinone oxidoreductase subunit A [Coriobacteriia bacterium]